MSLCNRLYCNEIHPVVLRFAKLSVDHYHQQNRWCAMRVSKKTSSRPYYSKKGKVSTKFKPPLLASLFLVWKNVVLLQNLTPFGLNCIEFNLES